MTQQSDKEYEKIQSEILNEAISETNKTETKPKNKNYGVIGVIIGVIGLFVPFIISFLFVIAGFGFTAMAHREKQKRWALASGILATINLIAALIVLIIA